MEKPDPADAGSTELHPCPICGRTFRPDALHRHQKVCQKNATKKRKVFDSSKQRAVEDTAAPSETVKQAPKKGPTKKTAPEPKPKPKNNWREKHEELIQTIKRSREKDDSKHPPEDKKRVPSDYVQCPACERHFNQRAAERHIPWCEQKKAQTPKSPATTDEAKEKLIARVRYRPPQGKSRLLNRKTKTASSLNSEETKEQPKREQGPHSSPPSMVDNRNSRNSRYDKINNNVTQNTGKRRSGSRGRELEVVTPPDLPLHIIKFKERFPNHNNKRNVDLEESFGTEQLRELMSTSKIPGRCPRTVPGVRLSGGRQNNNRNHNDNWNSRSTDVSRSASSSGGSTGSWNKRFTEDPTLPEVSSSELSGAWGKFCWSGDYENSMGSTGSSSGGSLPPLSRESVTDSQPVFYCHQCNSKFPLIAAKYCCECGAKRRGTPQGYIGQTG